MSKLRLKNLGCFSQNFIIGFIALRFSSNFGRTHNSTCKQVSWWTPKFLEILKLSDQWHDILPWGGYCKDRKDKKFWAQGRWGPIQGLFRRY